jgi:AcrR family transcriptional regulator
MGGEREDHEELRERLVVAALRVAAEHGLAELTVRRMAEAAGTSTMAVYSRFGGRAGVLEALYRRAFTMLREAFETAPRSGDRLIGLALAYRAFALENPPRYSFMFERPLVDFEPGLQLRSETLQDSFGPLIGAVRELSGDVPADAVRASYCLWSVMHGLVGLEIADVLGTPLPGWGIVAPQEGAAERMYVAGVRAMLVGLGLRPSA